MLEQLKKQNPGLKLFSIYDPEFLRFGRIVQEYDMTPWLEETGRFPVPSRGVDYRPDVPELHRCSLTEQVSLRLYGGMPVEVGLCSGRNTRLNALEYHRGNELDLAVTDLVLLLADQRDLRYNRLDSAVVEGFYMPAGSACDLFATTLHYAPCEVSPGGFQSVVVLPAGTNEPLASLPEPVCDEDRLLWMRNKWLLAHPESPEAAQGVCVGIQGENITLNY